MKTWLMANNFTKSLINLFQKGKSKWILQKEPILVKEKVTKTETTYPKF